MLLLLINQRSPHPFSDCRNKSPANVDNCFVPCVGRSGEGRSRIWRQQRSTFHSVISPFLPLAAETYVSGGGRENPMHKTHTHTLTNMQVLNQSSQNLLLQRTPDLDSDNTWSSVHNTSCCCCCFFQFQESPGRNVGFDWHFFTLNTF